jgi:hypothetical protein
VLEAFHIDAQFLEAYRETQQSLFERFINIDILDEERVCLAMRLVRSLEAVVTGQAEALAK